MPPRRAHTKSRQGCDQCKRRRVKCDEKGPPCSNCISRELPCTYLRAPARPDSRASQTPAPLAIIDTPLRPRIPRLTAPVSSTISAVRDLELMHKFSTETYKSLCSSSSEHYVWQIAIPRLALQYDFLMNGILALGALHIAATIEPPASLVYIDIALQYHNLTFAPYRAAVDSINPMNCEAALAQSIITTVIGIALPRVTAARGESSSITENIVVVFELLQGVRKIHRIGESWIKLELFTRRRNYWNSGVASIDSDMRDALERLGSLNDEALASIDPDQHQVNKDAIVYLRHFSARVGNSVDAANVLAWLAMSDKEFVDNVRRRQPLSLLILMHWGVLLGELDGQHWWARDSGRALVSELLDALHPGDMEWANAMAWARKKMGL
ncbi:transcriptional regulator family: Fungal Specific TF [Penicillium roqueforti]|uniref:Aflatoxin biosynthesis regulatory protein n=1 Tax=Penicillium roqueforti (strain FM164) TaxID=1365484 RepID=W6QU76_PENRF|nr:transcriptional regulator family: Fungal Specific TF [Penicillium roqueforti]CDM37684.1 Aflatoxin biosynthesis regulatory protein [Penicillium roqueforti FM164]KAF9248442.1 transcriptional regulator family: Fungal Specific TF [Penicillium roqueforti]KAI1831111.1 transcriptional regulator family: Fungal Specific TF [Penicillium roqueforti]KAI2674039.1 transcriptional regulator family: Fungal Specific TF [Penicillium roqueforti]KAI2682196.1 transcriptional regulator family: Fungal Specific TF